MSRLFVKMSNNYLEIDFPTAFPWRHIYVNNEAVVLSNIQKRPIAGKYPGSGPGKH